MLDRTVYDTYVRILTRELVPALGCTEPIAIALAAAKAREVLGEEPRRLVVKCSGNIIKNAKGVIVPTTGNMRGIDTSAVLGALAGNASLGLEVLSKVLPALTQPWEPQKSPIYRTLNGGDVTAIAQQLRSRILDDLEHSEEFAFFRGSPEYEQLRLLLEGEG